MGSTSTTASTASTAPASTTARVDEPHAARGDDAEVGLNLAVLWGRCSAGVEIRELESGRRLASFAVRTPASALPRRKRGGSESATSVPVTVWDPPAWLEGLEPDEAVVVVGTIRRRFFATRTGGRGAKAEVEAVSVARASRAQLDRAWQRASRALDAIS